MSDAYSGIKYIIETDYTIAIHYDANGTDIHNDNVDIFVDFSATLERYGATYFTLENIHILMTRYQKTGEANYGQYFWCSDMVIIKDLMTETIKESIADLLKLGEFRTVFKRYGNVD